MHLRALSRLTNQNISCICTIQTIICNFKYLHVGTLRKPSQEAKTLRANNFQKFILKKQNENNATFTSHLGRGNSTSIYKSSFHESNKAIRCNLLVLITSCNKDPKGIIGDKRSAISLV